MTAETLKSELANYDENETFSVTLKTGETVRCKRNPKGTAAEAAYQQVLARETIGRGDIVKASEIERID